MRSKLELGRHARNERAAHRFRRRKIVLIVALQSRRHDGPLEARFVNEALATGGAPPLAGERGHPLAVVGGPGSSARQRGSGNCSGNFREGASSADEGREALSLSAVLSSSAGTNARNALISRCSRSRSAIMAWVRGCGWHPSWARSTACSADVSAHDGGAADLTVDVVGDVSASDEKGDARAAEDDFGGSALSSGLAARAP